MILNLIAGITETGQPYTGPSTPSIGGEDPDIRRERELLDTLNIPGILAAIQQSGGQLSSEQLQQIVINNPTIFGWEDLVTMMQEAGYEIEDTPEGPRILAC